MYRFINYNRSNGFVSSREIPNSEVGPNYVTNEHRCNNGQYEFSYTDNFFNILYNMDLYDDASISDVFINEMVAKNKASFENRLSMCRDDREVEYCKKVANNYYTKFIESLMKFKKDLTGEYANKPSFDF